MSDDISSHSLIDSTLNANIDINETMREVLGGFYYKIGIAFNADTLFYNISSIPNNIFFIIFSINSLLKKLFILFQTNNSLYFDIYKNFHIFIYNIFKIKKKSAIFSYLKLIILEIKNINININIGLHTKFFINNQLLKFIVNLKLNYVSSSYKNFNLSYLKHYI